jgi:hypothetical protein
MIEIKDDSSQTSTGNVFEANKLVWVINAQSQVLPMSHDGYQLYMGCLCLVFALWTCKSALKHASADAFSPLILNFFTAESAVEWYLLWIVLQLNQTIPYGRRSCSWGSARALLLCIHSGNTKAMPGCGLSRSSSSHILRSSCLATLLRCCGSAALRHRPK